MYTLTLSRDERKAIDEVGHRYANGYDLFRLLWVAGAQTPDDVDWDYDGEITFLIPEHIAWKIHDLAEEDDNLWPLFAPELKDKMQRFVDLIV